MRVWIVLVCIDWWHQFKQLKLEFIVLELEIHQRQCVIVRQRLGHIRNSHPIFMVLFRETNKNCIWYYASLRSYVYIWITPIHVLLSTTLYMRYSPIIFETLHYDGTLGTQFFGVAFRESRRTWKWIQPVFQHQDTANMWRKLNFT